MLDLGPIERFLADLHCEGTEDAQLFVNLDNGVWEAKIASTTSPVPLLNADWNKPLVASAHNLHDALTELAALCN